MLILSCRIIVNINAENTWKYKTWFFCTCFGLCLNTFPRRFQTDMVDLGAVCATVPFWHVFSSKALPWHVFCSRFLRWLVYAILQGAASTCLPVSRRVSNWHGRLGGPGSPEFSFHMFWAIRLFSDMFAVAGFCIDMFTHEGVGILISP